MTLAPEKVAAIVQALEYIHEHPEEWDQFEWVAYRYTRDGDTRLGTYYAAPVEMVQTGACGTVACLAGRIALQQPEFEHRVSEYTEGRVVVGSRVWYGGEQRFVSEAVREFLLEGSTDRENDRYVVGSLFGGANNQDDLWHLAGELAGGPLTAPAGISLANGAERNHDYYEEMADGNGNN